MLKLSFYSSLNKLNFNIVLTVLVSRLNKQRLNLKIVSIKRVYFCGKPEMVIVPLLIILYKNYKKRFNNPEIAVLAMNFYGLIEFL